MLLLNNARFVEINTKQINVSVVLLCFAHMNEYCIQYSGSTALHCAVANGHIGVVKILLLDQRCDINACETFTKCTPIHGAATHGQSEIMELLLSDDRCNVNSKDKVSGCIFVGLK